MLRPDFHHFTLVQLKDFSEDILGIAEWSDLVEMHRRCTASDPSIRPALKELRMDLLQMLDHYSVH